MLAGKSTELSRFFKPRASFVSGVSWHATRVFFGLNLTCNKKNFQIRRYVRDIDILLNLQNGKAGKASKKANYEATGAIKAS
jgi:hypothetical protein